MAIFLVIFFVLGISIGSFLNVVAHRSVHGGSVFTGHSKCPFCKHELKPLDLVPLASFLALGGKCRYCGKPISIQYPLVELFTGLLFAYTYYFWSQNIQTVSTTELINLLFFLFAVSSLIVLFVTDLRESILPNSVVIPSVVVAGAFKLVLMFLGSISPTQLGYDILAAFIPALIFFAIVYLSSEKAMGGGDIKLVFLIGLVVGWPAILVGLFAGFLTGAGAAVTLLLVGKKRFGESIPFGPFLTMGGLLSLFWGQEILNLYLRTLTT